MQKESSAPYLGVEPKKSSPSKTASEKKYRRGRTGTHRGGEESAERDAESESSLHYLGERCVSAVKRFQKLNSQRRPYGVPVLAATSALGIVAT